MKMTFMGTHEASKLYGFTKQAVFNRHRRGTMPAPVAILKMGPIWDARDLIAHKKKLDREKP